MLQNFGTALSREEMKSVLGGLIQPPNEDGLGCKTDDDCGWSQVRCNGELQYVRGHCHSTKKTCSWTAVC